MIDRLVDIDGWVDRWMDKAIKRRGRISINFGEQTPSSTQIEI